MRFRTKSRITIPLESEKIHLKYRADASQERKLDKTSDPRASWCKVTTHAEAGSK